jgi:ABC-type iron transport system FetAB permease component
MNNKSLTITSLIVMAVLFIANQAGVALTEDEMQSFIEIITKLMAVGYWVYAYITRIARGDVKILGGRK